MIYSNIHGVCMSRKREDSSETTHSRMTRHLDIVSILVSAAIGATIEIILEKTLENIWKAQLHKKIGKSIMKLKLFIYDPNYQCWSRDIDLSRLSYSPITSETETTYTATRILRKFIINTRNYKTRTRVVKNMYLF